MQGQVWCWPDSRSQRLSLWFTFVVIVLMKMRQAACCNSKVNLDYVMVSRIANADTVSKTKIKANNFLCLLHVQTFLSPSWSHQWDLQCMTLRNSCVLTLSSCQLSSKIRSSHFLERKDLWGCTSLQLGSRAIVAH